jgi:hypothetical protein
MFVTANLFVGDDEPLFSELRRGKLFFERASVLDVLVKISVCPDVVDLRGPTKNGKLGWFFSRSDAFGGCGSQESSTTEIQCYKRGLTLIPLLL